MQRTDVKSNAEDIESGTPLPVVSTSSRLFAIVAVWWLCIGGSIAPTSKALRRCSRGANAAVTQAPSAAWVTESKF